MADDRFRDVDRAARRGDPESEAQMPRERCRVGQCCAHRDHQLPPLPPAAGSALVWVHAFGLDTSRGEADLTLRVVADSPNAIAAAVHWFQTAFPMAPHGEPPFASPLTLGNLLGTTHPPLESPVPPTPPEM